MAKRFTDTGLNRQPWYRKLEPKLKCAIRFLFDECDNAGVWNVDMETLSFFVGEKVTIQELFEGVNSDKDNRIEKFGRDKIFIPGFIEFQYGELSDKCKPHKHVMEKLKKHGLYQRVCEGLGKGIGTLQEKEQEKEKEEDKDVLGESVRGAKEKWNTNPSEKEQHDLDLTQPERSQCEEYIFRIKQQQLTPERINDFWEAFKIQQFTGGKFYQSRSDCVDHFRNWLKKHDDNFLNKIPDGKNGSKSKPGSTAAAAEWLNRRGNQSNTGLQ